MTPSWYDVLDVDPGADTETIRTRWRVAIAELDPADRRFRLLNQAAEVLLDPVRRSEHDVALAREAAARPEPAPPSWLSSQVTRPADDVSPARGAGYPGLATVLVAQARAEGHDETGKPAAAGTRWAGWSPPAWLLLGLALGTAAFVGLIAWQLSTPDDGAIEADKRAAQGAAEDAAVAVLSYDYRDLDANERTASAYLTPAFRRDYEKLFAQIEANADTVKPVVTAEVVASGVARVNADGDRVSVLVFVNRPTTNAQSATPRVYQDQATMQVVRVDGDWLLDDLTTSPVSP